MQEIQFSTSIFSSGHFEPLLAVNKFVEQHPHGGGVRQLTGRQYLEQASSSLVIAVQIGTKSALEQVKGIAAVPAIAVLFISPFHLGVSIGYQRPDGPSLTDGIMSVQKAAKGAGENAGFYCDSCQEAKEWANRGFLINSVMIDFIGL
ncbi:hypothetical protein AnigIFM63326_006115 [Aspergillus niger]|nr:hypothetical protein AnigIFM63326_006115 [Aspergillus niger]